MSVRAELLALLALVALLESCAAVAPPLGGPRDRTPPRRISSSPDSAARNVKQQFVRLDFSEPVITKELSKNLLITPQLPADNPYKLREDRNAITLLFEKPLDANTTYSFNFREGVVDITESLPAKNAVPHLQHRCRARLGQGARHRDRRAHGPARGRCQRGPLPRGRHAGRAQGPALLHSCHR